MKKTAYISGPISKIPDGNKDAFRHAQRLLEHRDYEVLSPHEICSEIKARDFANSEDYWKACMRACVKSMMDSDICVMLPGWTDSRGAAMEVSICRDLGIRTIELSTITALSV